MKRKISILSFAIANSFIMIILSFWMMSWPYVNGDEQLLIEYGEKVKSVFLGFEEKPSQDDFIFVNVAYDKQLVDKVDSLGFPIGKQDITDRALLSKFLTILAANPTNQKFIICDIFLAEKFQADPCLGDTLSPDIPLQEAIHQLPNILLSYHVDDNDQINYPSFKGNRGIASYASVNDLFLKFKLVLQDSLKSIPLLMFEYLHHDTLDQTGYLYKLQGNLLLNSFIPKFRIRQYDLFFAPPEDRYKIDNLSSILSGVMSPDEILNYVKGRIIVIGDFEDRDIHQTIYGDTGGPLILLNAYLGLLHGDGIISIWFLAFLWIMYFTISLTLVINQNQLASKLRFFPSVKINQQLKQLLSYSALLFITSLGSMIIFDKSISILYLALYLFLLKWIITYTGKPRPGELKEIPE